MFDQQLYSSWCLSQHLPKPEPGDSDKTHDHNLIVRIFIICTPAHLLHCQLSTPTIHISYYIYTPSPNKHTLYQQSCQCPMGLVV